MCRCFISITDAGECGRLPCFLNWNHDGSVTLHDFCPLLIASTNDNAVFSGDGITNNDDLFGFI